MTSRTGMSQVKFQVRHNALLLREFTVADIVRATGLNPESVRTELQRMKQEGLLTSHPNSEKTTKRGGRSALYRLTGDPEARLALSKSIEAFYPPLPLSDRPTSRYYLLARQLLDRAQTADDSQRKQLLTDAEHDLEMVEQAEGGSLASEIVRAYLQYERARLAYLSHEHKEAKRHFETLREFFVSTHDEAMVRRIDEFRLCLEAWNRLATAKPGSVSKTHRTRWLLDTLDEKSYQTDSPLISLLIQLLRNLSQSAAEEVGVSALPADKNIPVSPRLQWLLERIYATAETEIDCELLQAILPAYVEFEIGGGDPLARFPQVHAHLIQCPDCAEEYERLRKVAGLEARGRLPQAEESLAQFEDVPTPEPDEIIQVPHRDQIRTTPR